MMRSLFSGVAGLRTHQTRMDVIGNNIANVNTTAYKSQSMVFSDLMYQTTRAASGANAVTGVGGVNARQIGLGSKTSSIKTAIASQGSAQSTNDPFDIMINGSSFFVVSNGSENFFTRDGSFYIDGRGNLAMTSTGYNVMGWQVDPANPENIKKDTVSPLRLMTGDNMTYPPEATTKATVDGIVDKYDTDVNGESGRVMNLEIFDNQGYKYTVRLSVHAIDGDTGNFYVQLDDVLDSNGRSIGKDAFGFGGTITVPTQVPRQAENFTTTEVTNADGTVSVEYRINGTLYTLNANGYLESNGTEYDPGLDLDGDGTNEVYRVDQNGNLVDENGAVVMMDSTMTVESAATLQYVPGKGTFTGIGGAGNDSIMLTSNRVNFQNIELDFSATFNYNKNGTSTIGALAGEESGAGSGRKVGELSGITVQKDGMIYASYDNGMSRLLGQIAVANFANPSGLAKEGDNLYSATMNSGDFDGIGDDITEDGGYMESGVLEMSNVDLAAEFTEMITTQRGFQANSRIITVSDTLLEELTNLKR